MNIAADLLHWADRAHPVLVEPDGTAHSYQDIVAASGAAAALLADAGVRAGDRVVLLIPNGPGYLAAYYGTLILRAIAVPLAATSSAHHCRDVASICAPVLGVAADERSAGVLRDAGFRTLVLGAAAVATDAPRIDEPRDGPASDIAQIIFTSGTTGTPKGVALSHGALASNTAGIVEYLGLRAGDRAGVVLDFVYSYGNSLLQTHVRVGGTLVLLGALTFTKQVVQRLAAGACTGFAGVPSTFALLLRQGSLTGVALPALRYVTCAGGGLPVETTHRLRAALPDVDIVLMYGQTEASARLSYLPPDELLRKPSSVGKGMPGVMLEVLLPDGSRAPDGEEGEIVATGANIMSGYWNDLDATREAIRNGHLWTGDLAVRDADGYIHITGRRSELIKTAAYRVHPKEIEELIVEMGGVHECAVVGIADELMGEALVACFSSDDMPTVNAIRAHLRGRLPEYKWPRSVVRVAEFPRTTSGKIKRRELSRLAADALRSA